MVEVPNPFDSNQLGYFGPWGKDLDTPSDTIVPGFLLARRFLVERLLGQGAIGSVWLAHDRELNDEAIAVKVLHEGALRNRQSVADLKREVLITRRLRHPNILAVYNFWQDPAAQFITMEFVDGESLSAILAEHGSAMTIGEALPLIQQLCSALDFAHSKSVLHRDIKPANIIVERDGQVRLVDFGIARVIHDLEGKQELDRSGTIQFMSPEQLRGLPTDHRSDLYSLASTVYEMLAGRPPFVGSEIVLQVQVKAAERIEDLPDEVNAVLLRGLEKNPDRRYDTCGQFAIALQAAAESAGVLDEALAVQTVPVDEETVKLGRESAERIHVRLGSLLVSAGAIDQDQLDAALTTQQNEDAPLGEILLGSGALTESAMADALDSQLGLGRAHPTPIDAQNNLSKRLPEGFAQEHSCIPLEAKDGRILVAMADPLDLQTIDALERALDAPVEPRVATASEINAALGAD